MESQDYISYGGYEWNGKGTWEQIESNYKSAYKPFNTEEIYVFLFVGFFFAWLFVWFEFAHIISLLISIPAGGVIMILTAIIIIFLDYNRDYRDRHLSEKISVSIILFICLAILITTFLGLMSKNFNKKLLNILINLSYALAPGIIGLILLAINLYSGHRIPSEVSNCEVFGEEYIRNFDFLMTPEIFLATAFIGIFCFFPVIRKWRAKAE